MNPNFVAYGALLLWPAVSFYIYTKRPAAEATLWTILGALLLLPVGTFFKLPVFPQFDKYTVGNLAALIGTLFIARRPLRWTGVGLTELLMVVFVFSPFITNQNNGDVIVLERGGVLPSLGFYDAASFAASQMVVLIPFILGRQLLRNSTDNEQILRVLVVAGLLYSLLVLLEVRISPQLHNWVYGFMPSQFLQQMREGGFRPVVFLGHGLIVSFFVMTTLVAATALWRIRLRVNQFSPFANAAYLGVVLVLCKTLGALVYSFLLVPLVALAKPRLQMRVALVLAVFALTYPMLRITHFVPTQIMVEIASMVSQDRASSLQFRFDQEDLLMAHAFQRPWFGWGRFGRNRILDGVEFTVTDGRWIITFGVSGIFGFLAEFGLLALSIVRVATALRFTQTPREAVCLAALALIVAINLIDMLPNGWLTPVNWLLAGALLGRAEELRRSSVYGSSPAMGSSIARQS